mgnify:CR=1
MDLVFEAFLVLSPLAHVLFCLFAGGAEGASLVLGFVADWAAWGEPTDCSGVVAGVDVIAVLATFVHGAAPT